MKAYRGLTGEIRLVLDALGYNGRNVMMFNDLRNNGGRRIKLSLQMTDVQLKKFEETLVMAFEANRVKTVKHISWASPYHAKPVVGIYLNF